MTHEFTRICATDGIWIKGMAALLRFAGGGKLVPTKHGMEVWATDHEKFRYSFERICHEIHRAQ